MKDFLDMVPTRGTYGYLSPRSGAAILQVSREILEHVIFTMNLIICTALANRDEYNHLEGNLEGGIILPSRLLRCCVVTHLEYVPSSAIVLLGIEGMGGRRRTQCMF